MRYSTTPAYSATGLPQTGCPSSSHPTTSITSYCPQARPIQGLIETIILRLERHKASRSWWIVGVLFGTEYRSSNMTRHGAQENGLSHRLPPRSLPSDGYI